MRIIAGRAKSLPLKSVPGKNTRPTTDRIKETLFNVIQHDIYDCVFLDLFSGSGGIGLEAVSRGAKKAVLVDKEKAAIECIQANVAFTKFDKECLVLNMDYMSALKKLEGTCTFDIIFLDPPYDHEFEKNVILYLNDSALVHEQTMIIAEASLETDFSYVDDTKFELYREKKYKTNKHVFLRIAESE